MTIIILAVQIVVFVNICRTGWALCFFGQDMQGYYLTQSTVSRGTDIDYLEVIVMQDSISIWGQCHRRFGNNVILYDMAGNSDCMRCFLIIPRSKHILELYTEGLERCYTNEGAALTKCPTQNRHSKRSSVEIMLYKTGNLVESRIPLAPIYCPIEGRYLATYNRDDGTESSLECPNYQTVVSNCPRGNEINILFRGCTFANFAKNFECLASWPGTDGDQFLILRDPSVGHKSQRIDSGGPPVPKYRCALFHKDSLNPDRVYLAFSSDSTCFNNLRSPWEGFESLVLERQPQPPVSPRVNRSSCQFPTWSQGQWEQLRVRGNIFTFTDLQFKVVSCYCVESPLTVGGPFAVYTQNHCGEEAFGCLFMEQRSANVIEYRIDESGDTGIGNQNCHEKPRHHLSQWITQSRVDRYRESPCPVAGEYTGIIPDERTLCAKLYSDCNNLEIMFYTVYSCFNRSSVKEEREYRCLGQWVESNVTYTYTERRDATGHECFAGVVAAADEVYITEAGINCQRGLRPLTHGMRLLKQADCQNGRARISYGQPRSRTPVWGTRNEYSSNKPKRDPQPSSSRSLSASDIINTLLSSLAIVLVRYRLNLR